MKPNNKEAEKAFLGAVLLHPEIINKTELVADDFHYTIHQDIFRAMKAVGDNADVMIVADILRRNDKLDEIGGELYLAELVGDCPNYFNWETYSKIVRDMRVRRRVIEQAEILAKAAFDESKNVNDAIALTVSSLVREARPSGGAVEIGVFLKQLYEQVEKRAEDPKQIYGLATGLRDFDLITKGFQKGEEFIIAGEPGIGKSLLAIQLACGVAEKHHGVIYELEMTGLAILRRRASALSKIETDTMLSGVGMTEKWTEFAQAVERLEKLKVHISDQSDWNTLQMRADLSRLKESHDIEWFLVDYMDLLTDNVGKDGVENSAYISRQLHAIAKDLDLAGIVIHSMNKAGMEKLKPGMGALSGSAKVSYDADQIITLTEDKEIDNVINMTWVKQRESDVDRLVKLTKIPGLPLFQPCITKMDEPSVGNWWDK